MLSPIYRPDITEMPNCPPEFLANEVRFTLKLFSKWNANERIPNEHKRDKSKKDVSADPSFVTHGLVNHPKSPDIANKDEAHQKES